MTPDLWTRRQFSRTLGLTLLGGIFVPKYERWFRPNAPAGLLTIAWPEHRQGDLALMFIETTNEALEIPGWDMTRQMPTKDGKTTVGIWSRRNQLPNGYRQKPVVIPARGRAIAQIHTFRGVEPEDTPIGRIARAAHSYKGPPMFVDYSWSQRARA